MVGYTPRQSLSPLMNVMVQAAYKAAKGLIRDFGEIENLQVSKKGPADFVSNADLRSDKVLREELSKARPSFGFLTEEGGEQEGEDPSHRWVIDPLDGTTNFLHGIPHFNISIALEKDLEAIAAVIYDPIKDELFWAEKGAGAFMNDRRMRVSQRKDLSESLFAIGTPFRGHGYVDRFLEDVQPFLNLTPGVRRFGAAALDLAYVAAGRFDGFWERSLSPWDIAAGILLVREAGGYVTTLEGKPATANTPDIIAAPPAIHTQLLPIFNTK